jgi:hypothetical protein
MGRRVVNPEIAFKKIGHLPFLTKTFEVLSGYDDKMGMYPHFS